MINPPKDIIELHENAIIILRRIHAAMIRCRWHEPTGMDEGEDSALNLEREVREFLGVEE